MTLTQRYAPSMRLVHMVMAVCILMALYIGFYNGTLPSEWRAAAWRLHKSLGFTVVMLLPLRIYLRNTRTLPSIDGAWWERMLAHRTHQLLYVSMAAVALSGYVMVAAKGKELLWFGLSIPPLVPLNPDLAKLARHWHEPFAYLLVTLLALHLVGLVKHRLVDKTNLLPRMF